MPRRNHPQAKDIRLKSSAPSIKGGIIDAVLSNDDPPKRGRGRPRVVTTSGKTFAEEIASVMRGGRIMNAKQVVDSLYAANVDIHSVNPTSYVGATLGMAHSTVTGANGKPIKLPTFTRVETGLYRVATKEDHRLLIEEAGGSAEPLPKKPKEGHKPKAERAQTKGKKPEEKQVKESLMPPEKLREMMRQMMAEHLKPVIEEEIRNIPQLQAMVKGIISEQLQPILQDQIRSTLQRMLEN
jgi:hypothetical protein